MNAPTARARHVSLTPFGQCSFIAAQHLRGVTRYDDLMGEPSQSYRIAQLLTHRKAPLRDHSLAFIKDQFKREVEKPHKQLAKLVDLWEKLVPGDLAQHTRLDALQRGVLRVSVDSSVRLYELDRLLRSGLEQTLITRYAGPALRRIRLQVSSSF